MTTSVLLRILSALALLLGLTSTPAQAQTQITNTPFTVNTATDNPDTNPGDGICADLNSKCSLRAAVMEADALAGDDEILLARGATYPIANTLLIDNPADSLSIHSVDGSGANATISGPSAPRKRAFTISDTSVFLTNLTIEDSYGIYVSGFDAELYLTGVIMQNLTGISGTPGDERAGGGALFVEASFVSIISSYFINNSSTGNGGAIFNDGGKVGIYLSDFIGNSALNGGAIFNWSMYTTSPMLMRAQLNITSSNFLGNSASQNGGALYLNGYNQLTPSPQTAISFSRFAGNHAAYGGGMYIGNGTAFDLGAAYITASEISGNSADYDGGGLYFNTTSNILSLGFSYLDNTTLSGNSADRNGGGIHIQEDSSGVIYGANLTITDNTADADGNGGQGGGYYGAPGTQLQLANSILAANHDASSGTFPLVAYDCQGTISAEYTLIGYFQLGVCEFYDNQDTNLYSSTTPIDPLLADLAEGGYATQTHALLQGSPAIDRGDPAGCKNPRGELLLYDQRGEARHLGWACDLGAYESTFSAGRVFLPAVMR